MAHGDKDKKENTDRAAKDRKTERQVKDVLRPASKDAPGKSAGKTNGKKD